MSKYNWDERHIITFPEEKVVLSTKDLHVYYGTNESIKGVDMQFEKNKITALIGPSGSGKSTYLRSLNRMNFGMKESMSIVQISMSMKCASTLGWFSNDPILLPNQYTKISPSLMNVLG